MGMFPLSTGHFFQNGGQVRKMQKKSFFCRNGLYPCWYKIYQEATRFWKLFEILVHPTPHPAPHTVSQQQIQPFYHIISFSKLTWTAREQEMSKVNTILMPACHSLLTLIGYLRNPEFMRWWFLYFSAVKGWGGCGAPTAFYLILICEP